MTKVKKNLVIILLCTLALLSGCREEKPPIQTVTTTSGVNEKVEMKTIVALGDSLSAGFGVDISESYPSRLERKLQGQGYNYKVVNAGVSGETSSGTLARLNWILGLRPDIVILETGANDGLRGTDVALLEENLRTIITTLQKKDIGVLLAGMKMVWNLGPDYVDAFNAVYPRVAEDKNVLLMPFFLEGVATQMELNLGDGVHPNGNGYEIITENIYPFVLQLIRSVDG